MVRPAAPAGGRQQAGRERARSRRVGVVGDDQTQLAPQKGPALGHDVRLGDGEQGPELFELVVTGAFFVFVEAEEAAGEQVVPAAR